ncbi:hypothetical protein GGS20DRAFT_555435 [Poronia punctata]|nr:hypothetical protein GGS20DRAFT_555435 [Poronia punctata]
MRLMQTIPLFASIPEIAAAAAATSLYLNITAIGAQSGSSTLECWQMTKPFNTSAEPGISGTAQADLGSVSSLGFNIIPPAFDGGIHNAPRNQWVAFLSGLAYITLPNDPETSAYVTGGEFGLVFAADTADVSEEGHRTEYPGLTETVALQIPTVDGKVPDHKVLHDGPCVAGEVTGVRDFAMTNSRPAVDADAMFPMGL